MVPIASNTTWTTPPKKKMCQQAHDARREEKLTTSPVHGCFKTCCSDSPKEASSTSKPKMLSEHQRSPRALHTKPPFISSSTLARKQRRLNAKKQTRQDRHPQVQRRIATMRRCCRRQNISRTDVVKPSHEKMTFVTISIRVYSPLKTTKSTTKITKHKDDGGDDNDQETR